MKFLDFKTQAEIASLAARAETTLYVAGHLVLSRTSALNIRCSSFSQTNCQYKHGWSPREGYMVCWSDSGFPNSCWICNIYIY